VGATAAGAGAGAGAGVLLLPSPQAAMALVMAMMERSRQRQLGIDVIFCLLMATGVLDAVDGGSFARGPPGRSSACNGRNFEGDAVRLTVPNAAIQA
jgi:hypothetical protein